jgi:hypothetical protein
MDDILHDFRKQKPMDGGFAANPRGLANTLAGL